jgi:hypothetical protein
MSVIESNKVNQKNIQAGGHVSGGNMIVNENHFHNYNSPPIYIEDRVLKSLLIEHEKEKDEDPEYRKFSDELNKFFSKSLRAKPRNLEEKLSDGGRGHLVELAMDAKEKVTKKIERFSNFKSAQEIYTYLLTNIRTAFVHEVQSKIKSCEFAEHQIDDIVKSNIIDPFLHNLAGSSLAIDRSELYGLLYFLTGNCYIEWD